MNNIIFELKSILRQIKKISSLYKSSQDSIDFESYKYMEEQRVKTNLKRLIPTMIMIFIFMTTMLISYDFKYGKYSERFYEVVIHYCVSIGLMIIYTFSVANVINTKNIKIAKHIYMTFWIFYGSLFCSFLITNYKHSGTFNVVLLVLVVCLVVPVFNKLESLIIICTLLILSIVAIYALKLNIYYLVTVIPLLIIASLVFLTTYFSRMNMLYTQSIIERRGYLVQRRIDSIFSDLFDEVYEINLNTEESTLVHSKGTFQPLYINDSYDQNMEYITSELLHQEDADTYYGKFSANSIKKAFKQGEKQIYQESRRLKTDGEYAWVSTLMIREYSSAEDKYNLMQLVQNIDGRKLSENKLKIEAQRDKLTMLYNKITTQKMIEDYLQNEGSKGAHAFIIIDMDGFKEVNDTKGHLAGDDVLVAVADKLRKYLRESDVVGRIGGDEFVAFIKNVQSVALVCDKIQKISSAIKMYGVENDYGHSLSTSVGIAIYGKDGKTYEELYKNADRALYEAKRNGKDQYKFFIREEVNIV